MSPAGRWARERKFMLKTHKKDLLCLLALCLLGGLYGLSNGQDVNWDLLNYHFYNPFAFLHGRFYTDVMPAGIHTFLNPLLDIPYYLLVRHLNDWPKLIAFLQGIPAGVFWFVGYKICRLFLGGKDDVFTVVAAAVTGLSGSMVLSQIGLSTNEVPLAALMCAAIYGVFRVIAGTRHAAAWTAASALMAGAAVGLKYTAAPFVLGLSAAFFLFVRQTDKPLRNALWFATGGLAGFLLVNGYFMARLWVEYKNPVFPFFNQIFQSPYFDPVNFDEVRFYPRSIGQWLAYPFYWVQEHYGVVTEMPVADARLALGYVGFFVTGALLLAGKFTQPRKRLLAAAWVFAAVSYVFWLHFYSTLRYAIVLELFSMIFVFAAIRALTSYKTTAVLGTLLALFLWQTTEIPNWGTDGFSKQAIVFTNFPKVEKNTLVVYFGAPMGFLSPFFEPGTRFVGGITFPVEKYPKAYQKRAKSRNSLPPQYYAYRFDGRIRQAIAEHDGPIYIVAVPWPMMLDPITLAPYGLEKTDEPCQEFNASINLYSAGWALCKVKKIAPASAS